MRRAWRSAQRLGAQIDALWVRKPGHDAERRRSRSRSRPCAGSRSCSARTSSRRRGTTSSRPCAASSYERGSTYVFVGTPDESRRPRDPQRLAPLGARPRAARASTSASSPTAPTGRSRWTDERARRRCSPSSPRCSRSRSRSFSPRGDRREGARCGRAAGGSSSRSPAALDPTVLDAAIRIARAEEAVLVPAYLLDRAAALRRGLAARATQVEMAMPLLEAVEHAALRAGVPVDARIEKGRTLTHALQRLWEVERLRPDRRAGAGGRPRRLHREGARLAPHERADGDAGPEARRIAPYRSARGLARARLRKTRDSSPRDLSGAVAPRPGHALRPDGGRAPPDRPRAADLRRGRDLLRRLRHRGGDGRAPRRGPARAPRRAADLDRGRGRSWRSSSRRTGRRSTPTRSRAARTSSPARTSARCRASSPPRRCSSTTS